MSSTTSKPIHRNPRDFHVDIYMSDEEVGLSDDSDKDPDFNFFKESKNVEADTSDSESNDESKRKKKSRKSKPKMKKYSKLKQSNITKSTIVDNVSDFQHGSMNELTGREISGVVVTTGIVKLRNIVLIQIYLLQKRRISSRI